MFQSEVRSLSIYDFRNQVEMGPWDVPKAFETIRWDLESISRLLEPAIAVLNVGVGAVA